MGIMDTPSFASGVMFKIPFYALIFYTFNTLTFGLSLMDSVLGPMMGVTEEMMPIVTGSVPDAMFLGYSVVNLVLAGFMYPYSFLPQEAVKGQQLLAALFFIGFLPIMFVFFNVGLLGLMGIVPYAVMNTALGVVALLNYQAL